MANILDLASVITSIEEQIAQFGLLARTKSCSTCSHAMDMQSRSDISDKYRYIQRNALVHNVFCVKVEVSSVELQEVGWPLRWHDKSKSSLRQ